jgi:hypothetical protein
MLMTIYHRAKIGLSVRQRFTISELHAIADQLPKP